MPALSDSGQLFRRARRRDWAVVAVSHVWALLLTVLVVVGLCAPSGNRPLAIAFPHLVYWMLSSELAVGTAWAWVFLLAMPWMPIWLYRVVSYYRHGGTWWLLAAGWRGRWLKQGWFSRLGAAALNAALPTWFLVRAGAPPRAFEQVDPPLRRPGRSAPHVFLALAISLHHWPFAYAAKSTLGVDPPWTIWLPSWAGPCQIKLGGASLTRASFCEPGATRANLARISEESRCGTGPCGPR